MEKKEPFVKIALAFAAIYLIWGSTYLAIRFAIETLPPFLMAGIRFSTAGILLFLFVKPKLTSPIKLIHWKSAFIAGGFLLLGGNGGVVWAEQFVPSGLAALLIATEPLWIVLLSWASKSSGKPSLTSFSGVLLGLAGLYFLLDPLNINNTKTDITGVLFVLGASLSWAIGSLYSRHAVMAEGITAAAMQMIAGGFLLTITGLIMGEAGEINFQGISLKSFAAFLYLIFIGSIIAFTSYIYLIKAAGPSKASTYAYVNPVVAVFLGWLLADEIVTMKTIIAAAIIIFSVVLINSNFKNVRIKKYFTKAYDK